MKTPSRLLRAVSSVTFFPGRSVATVNVQAPVRKGAKRGRIHGEGETKDSLRGSPGREHSERASGGIRKGRPHRAASGGTQGRRGSIEEGFIRSGRAGRDAEPE